MWYLGLDLALATFYEAVVIDEQGQFDAGIEWLRLRRAEELWACEPRQVAGRSGTDLQFQRWLPVLRENPESGIPLPVHSRNMRPLEPSRLWEHHSMTDSNESQLVFL
jgi:hypothetical protein